MDTASSTESLAKPPLTLEDLKRKTVKTLGIELSVGEGFEDMAYGDIQEAYSNFDKFLDSLEKNQILRQAFIDKKTRIEITPSGLNQAIFDENKNVFRFRYDASPDFAFDYAENTLLGDMGGSGNNNEQNTQSPQVPKGEAEGDPIETLKAKGFVLGENLMKSEHLHEIAEKFNAALTVLKDSGVDISVFTSKTLNIGTGDLLYYNATVGFVASPVIVNMDIGDLVGFINYCALPDRVASQSSIFFQDYINYKKEKGIDSKLNESVSQTEPAVKEGENGEFENAIKNAKNLDEIFVLLRKTQEIKGEGTTYQPETLISIIKNIWAHPEKFEAEIGAVPDARGITAKIIELFESYKRLAEEIKSSTSFDELYEVLRKYGGVQGSQEYVNAEKLIADIESLRKIPATASVFHAALSIFTRNAGLRKKIEELLHDMQSDGVNEPAANLENEIAATGSDSQASQVNESINLDKMEEKPDVPEWRKGEEWEKFDELRREALRAKTGKTPRIKKMLGQDDNMLKNQTQEVYEAQKKIIEQKIRENIKKTFIGRFGSGPLSVEQEEMLKRELNSTMFNELVENENSIYTEIIRENRAEKWGKAGEAFRKLTSSRAVMLYRGLSKNKQTAVRMITSIVIGGTVGLATGAAVSAGVATYMGMRGARVVASGLMGLKAGEWAEKKWSIEEINKKEQDEIEALKFSEKNIDEKNKEYEEIKKKYKKERVKAVAKKAGTIAIAGGATGALIGALEYIPTMGGPSNVFETGKIRGATLQEQRISRGNFEPSSRPKAPVENTSAGGKTSVPQDTKAQRVEVGEAKPKTASEVGGDKKELEQAVEQEKPRARTEEVSEQEKPKVAAQEKPKTATVPPAEKFFSDPNIVKHEVKAGDSVWRLLNKTMENNREFKMMTEAQKTYVLSSMSNKVMASPTEFGIRGDGLAEGDKVDLGKLFEDSREVKSVMEKAKQTIVEGSAKEKAILMNNLKIKHWLKANPGRELTSENLEELLNAKPTPDEINVSPMPEKLVQGPLGTSTAEINTNATQYNPKGLGVDNQSVQDIVSNDLKFVVGEEFPKEENAEVVRAEGTDFAKQSVAFVAPAASALYSKVSVKPSEIPSFERRPQENVMPINARPEKVFYSDSIFNQKVEEAFRADIDKIYGRSLLLGFGHIQGVNTEEWGEMARLPANMVIEYYMGDSQKSGLPQEMLSLLGGNKKHDAFLRHVAWLMEESKGAVKPYENNETMEQFVKRLGGYLMKKQPSEFKMAV